MRAFSWKHLHVLPPQSGIQHDTQETSSPDFNQSLHLGAYSCGVAPRPLPPQVQDQRPEAVEALSVRAPSHHFKVHQLDEDEARDC